MSTSSLSASPHLIKQGPFKLLCFVLPLLLVWIFYGVASLFIETSASARAFNKSAYGEVYWPLNASEVGKYFNVEGRIDSIPAEGELWIATQTDSGYEVKASLPAHIGYFKAEYTEDAGRYQLVAFFMDAQQAARAKSQGNGETLSFSAEQWSEFDQHELFRVNLVKVADK